LLLISCLAFADHQFCCEDSNWQQKMLDAYNTRTHTTDFSYPSGPFRQKCDRCQYDLNVLSCYCEDQTGRVSYFPSLIKTNNNFHIYSNEDGFLKHGDQ
jgi:hypothetical protein